MGNKFYFKSLSRLIKSRPLYAMFLLVIVIFSVVFTSYIYRIGMGFAYDGAAEPPFSYSFSTQKTIEEIESDLSETFSKYNLLDYYFLGSSSYIDTVTYNGEQVEIKSGDLYDITEQHMEYLPNIFDYISKEDIEQGKKYVLINTTEIHANAINASRLDILLSTAEVGDEIVIQGITYTVAGIDVFEYKVETQVTETLTGYHIISSLAKIAYVNSNEMLNTFNKRSVHIETEEQISSFKIKSIAKANGMEFTGTDIPLVLLVALIIAAAIGVLFVLNAAILFRYLIKSQEKLYVMYKMLGAKTHQLLLTMVLQTVPICALGVAIGIGIDFLVAPITPYIQGTVTTLNGMGIFCIVVLNMVGMLIGLILAGIKSARALPCDGEKGLV